MCLRFIPPFWLQPSVPLLALPWDSRGSHSEAGLGEHIWGPALGPRPLRCGSGAAGSTTGEFQSDFQVELCNGTSSLWPCTYLFAAFVASSAQRRLAAAAFAWKFPTSLLELVCYFLNYIMLFHVYDCSFFFFFFFTN